MKINLDLFSLSHLVHRKLHVLGVLLLLWTVDIYLFFTIVNLVCIMSYAVKYDVESMSNIANGLISCEW